MTRSAGRRPNARPDACLGFRSFGSAVLAAMIVVLLTQAAGCASPEARHSWLSFLFDGVPPLSEPGAEVGPDDLLSGGAIGVSHEIRIKSIHGPYSKKECSTCHASAFSNRLVARETELCWECHELEDFAGPFVHGPVSAGTCLGCHDPHESRNEHLLVETGPALCEYCHDQSTFARIAEHRAEKGDRCQSCHDPHAGESEYMLAAEANE